MMIWLIAILLSVDASLAGTLSTRKGAHENVNDPRYRVIGAAVEPDGHVKVTVLFDRKGKWPVRSYTKIHSKDLFSLRIDPLHFAHLAVTHSSLRISCIERGQGWESFCEDPIISFGKDPWINGRGKLGEEGSEIVEPKMNCPALPDWLTKGKGERRAGAEVFEKNLKTTFKVVGAKLTNTGHIRVLYRVPIGKRGFTDLNSIMLDVGVLERLGISPLTFTQMATQDIDLKMSCGDLPSQVPPHFDCSRTMHLSIGRTTLFPTADEPQFDHDFCDKD